MTLSTSLAGAGVASKASFLRTTAFAISFLVHGALFVSFGGALSASPSDMTSESVTRLSFLQPAPIPEEVEEKHEEPIEELPKKIEKVEEVVQEKYEKREPEKRELPQVEPEVQQVASALTDNIPQIKEGIIRWERERYLSDVLAHIEHHKWYPKIARRMGVEGEVMVRFVLHADGSAQGLQIENGPEALMTAARKTVERSMPLPRPPEMVDCPIECEFRMRFSLSDS